MEGRSGWAKVKGDFALFVAREEVGIIFFLGRKVLLRSGYVLARFEIVRSIKSYMRKQLRQITVQDLDLDYDRIIGEKPRT